ncbi:hypothetical protein [Hydrogenophaga sp. NFH-34]|nr:hypothetical protein [Hydrogenophaga sp. NFH-34]
MAMAAAWALAGCGMEAAGSAATAAALKQQELEQGKATQKVVEQQLQDALQQGTDRLQKLDQEAGQ